MIHLRDITANKFGWRDGEYPFNLPFLRTFESLAFTTDVTFFIGENGSGKSTLLEAIASAAGSIAVGSDELQHDPTLESAQQLGKSFKLGWSKRTRKGFFMRSEDFFGYAKRMIRVQRELTESIRQVDEEYKGRSAYAKQLAKMPYSGELHALKQSYGNDLDSYSHGESFFQLFRARFKPGGLYLLDEPEAPLSPLRQLALLTLLHEMVGQESQFIIATHSPILMAYPKAQILSFDGGAIKPLAYEDTEHFKLTRAFLNNPDSYLKHLFES